MFIYDDFDTSAICVGVGVECSVSSAWYIYAKVAKLTTSI
jgi:hypothetical protein